MEKSAAVMRDAGYNKGPRTPNASYDGCDESDDTEQNARSGYRKGVC